MAEHHGKDARGIANGAFGIGMEVGTADADRGDAHLHFTGAGIWNGALNNLKVAHADEFGGACGSAHRLTNRRTSAASAGTHTTELPPLMVLLPLKSKNRAPASSVIILGAARSQG